MKLILLALFLSLQFPIFSNPTFVSGSDIHFVNNLNIENGWYEATVKYFNPKTYTKSTYTLNVKVEYNRVIVIDFGNGGSVHSGYNNSGYFYNGGNLMFQKDFNGNVTSATTTVSVSEGSSSVNYEISIQ
jgi:hypothetical protein